MPRVTHFEIPANDPDKVIEFYKSVFGWEVNKWEGPVDYWLITTGEPGTPGIDGAVMKTSEGFSTTVNTIDVKDIEAVVGKVEASGGEVVGEKQTIPGIGYQIYVKDVEGTLFGLHQEDPSAGQ